jgi:universal stress protein E
MQQFNKILCVVSADDKKNSALTYAVKLAENNQASLTVIDIMDWTPLNIRKFDRSKSSDYMQVIVAQQQNKLDEVISALNSKLTIQSKVLVGVSFLEIIYEVLRNGHDIVLKTAQSGGLLDRLFGTDDMQLLRKCPCPLMLVKPKAHKNHLQILASVDVDDNYPSQELSTRQALNFQILELASWLAISESAELDIVHVWDAASDDAMRFGFTDESKEKIDSDLEASEQRYIQKMNDLMDKIRAKVGSDASTYIKSKTHLLVGRPRKQIPIFAEQIAADIIVMGTVARTGLPGFLMGNSAENILNQIDCSVLAVKPEGFVSPVKLIA